MFVIGEFNAKIATDHKSHVARKYALGEQNKRGEIMVDFDEKYDLIICNKLFKHHERRLYT